MSEGEANFIIPLFDDLDEDELGAVPKFQITGPNVGGSEQTRNLVDVDIGNTLVVQCQLAHVCHGTMTRAGAPATLIVMLFAFQPKRNNRRFKHVRITMVFSSGANASGAPVVERISPSGEFSLYRSEKTEEISHAFKPSLEGSAGPAKATLGYEWQLTSTQQRQDRATISGMSRGTPVGSAEHHTVVWTLSENESTKSGIPSLFRAAILLERNRSASDPLGEKFFSTLEISGKVSRREEIGGSIKHVEKMMSGKEKKDEHIFFDPSRSDFSIVKDPQSLYKEDLNKFRRLVTIQDWTDGEWQAEVRAEDYRNDPSPVLRAAQAAEQPPQERDTAKTEPRPLAQPNIVVPRTQEDLEDNTPSSLTVGVNYQTTSDSLPELPIASPLPAILEEMAQSQAPQPQRKSQQPDTLPQPSPSAKAARTEQRLQELRHEIVQVTDQRLAELHSELARVRLEANLVRRLLKLEQEEQKIVQEITRLESQKPE